MMVIEPRRTPLGRAPNRSIRKRYFNVLLRGDLLIRETNRFSEKAADEFIGMLHRSAACADLRELAGVGVHEGRFPLPFRGTRDCTHYRRPLVGVQR
jgi:hypothetical protein